MIAVLIICSFIGNNNFECDRGQFFDDIEECYTFADKLTESKNVVARCEVIKDIYAGP